MRTGMLSRMAPQAASGGIADVNGAFVRRVANQAIPTAGNTAISWDTEDRDEGGYWAGGTPTRITFAANGWYSLSVGITWEGIGTGIRVIDWLINGITWRRIGYSPFRAVAVDQGGGLVRYFSAADYVEAVVFQDRGGDLNLTGWLGVVALF